MKPVVNSAKESSWGSTRWTKWSKFESNWQPITWDTLSSEFVPIMPPKRPLVKCAWINIFWGNPMVEVPGTIQDQDPKSLRCTTNSPKIWLVNSAFSSGDTWPAIIGVRKKAFKKAAFKRPLLKDYLQSTLFENYSKCLIWIYEFWHFPPIFVLVKLTCLATLFDRNLHFFKNSPKEHFWHF